MTDEALVNKDTIAACKQYEAENLAWRIDSPGLTYMMTAYRDLAIANGLSHEFGLDDNTGATAQMIRRLKEMVASIDANYAQALAENSQ